MSETTKKALPEATFRYGAIKATVWKNVQKANGNEFTVRNINLDRGYKDKEGNWQSTTSMQSGDLPKAIRALQAAQDHCWTADAKKKDDNESE